MARLPPSTMAESKSVVAVSSEGGPTRTTQPRNCTPCPLNNPIPVRQPSVVRDIPQIDLGPPSRAALSDMRPRTSQERSTKVCFPLTPRVGGWHYRASEPWLLQQLAGLLDDSACHPWACASHLRDNVACALVVTCCWSQVYFLLRLPVLATSLIGFIPS